MISSGYTHAGGTARNGRFQFEALGRTQVQRRGCARPATEYSASRAGNYAQILTVFDQIGYSDFAYVRFAGVEAIALALLMVTVANHLEDNWWWSWAFVVATGALAIVAIVNVAAGLPHGSSSGLWWLVFAVNVVLALGLLWGLAKTGTERSPV